MMTQPERNDKPPAICRKVSFNNSSTPPPLPIPSPSINPQESGTVTDQITVNGTCTSSTQDVIDEATRTTFGTMGTPYYTNQQHTIIDDEYSTSPQQRSRLDLNLDGTDQMYDDTKTTTLVMINQESNDQFGVSSPIHITSSRTVTTSTTNAITATPSSGEERALAAIRLHHESRFLPRRSISCPLSSLAFITNRRYRDDTEDDDDDTISYDASSSNNSVAIEEEDENNRMDDEDSIYPIAPPAGIPHHHQRRNGMTPPSSLLYNIPSGDDPTKYNNPNTTATPTPTTPILPEALLSGSGPITPGPCRARRGAIGHSTLHMASAILARLELRAELNDDDTATFNGNRNGNPPQKQQAKPQTVPASTCYASVSMQQPFQNYNPPLRTKSTPLYLKRPYDNLNSSSTNLTTETSSSSWHNSSTTPVKKQETLNGYAMAKTLRSSSSLGEGTKTSYGKDTIPQLPPRNKDDDEWIQQQETKESVSPKSGTTTRVRYAEQPSSRKNHQCRNRVISPTISGSGTRLPSLNSSVLLSSSPAISTSVTNWNTCSFATNATPAKVGSQFPTSYFSEKDKEAAGSQEQRPFQQPGPFQRLSFNQFVSPADTPYKNNDTIMTPPKRHRTYS